jgi:hypothetical protein
MNFVCTAVCCVFGILEPVNPLTPNDLQRRRAVVCGYSYTVLQSCVWLQLCSFTVMCVATAMQFYSLLFLIHAA